MTQVNVSIVVPTLNEAENIPQLVERVANAMSGRDWEMLIVDDDSRDGTPQVCAELAEKYPLRLLVRKRPAYGLSGAVLHGFAHARGNVLVVMDADLQHPPEKIPELVDTVVSGQADFVIGSRYAGGTMAEQWGAFRRLNSFLATLLARPFAGNVKDPMSGFFALRRETFECAQRLSPMGYKIALELICKCRVKQVREIPIHFGVRQRGQSKLTLKQQFHYLQHLSRLYDFTFPRLAPIMKFLIVLMIGFVLAAVAFAVAVKAGAALPIAAVIAYLAHLLVTAVFHLRYIRAQWEFLVNRRPWVDFMLVSLVELVAVAGSGYWLIWRIGTPAASEVLVITFLVGTVVRYILRKELLLDVRGLRRNVRAEELGEKTT